MCECTDMICLLAGTCTARRCIFTHRCTRTNRLGSLSRESACEFRDTGEEKCKCSSLQVSDMASMGRWTSVCVCVRERRRWRKERFRERDGADSLRIRRVSPPALMHFAVKEHACQAAKIDDGLRRMWRRQKVLFCLLMFLISSPPISLFSSVTCFCHPWRRMQAMLHIFLFLNSLLYLPHLSESHVAPPA